MKTLQSKRPFAAHHRASPTGAGIEWEELPSLALSLISRRAPFAAAADAADSAYPPGSQAAPPWDDTLPVSFDELPSAAPSVFREALDGLATREVTEPDVFRHFFGNPAHR